MRTAKTLIRLGDVQADLSLRWVHMSFCWFCQEAAQIFSDSTIYAHISVLSDTRMKLKSTFCVRIAIAYRRMYRHVIFMLTLEYKIVSVT